MRVARIGQGLLKQQRDRCSDARMEPKHDPKTPEKVRAASTEKAHLSDEEKTEIIRMREQVRTTHEKIGQTIGRPPSTVSAFCAKQIGYGQITHYPSSTLTDEEKRAFRTILIKSRSFRWGTPLIIFADHDYIFCLCRADPRIKLHRKCHHLRRSLQGNSENLITDG